MIQIVREGNYRLIETKHQTKLLYLDSAAYAWINTEQMGEILVSTHKPHKADCLLAQGRYRLYNVKDEKRLTDLLHLELSVGSGKWQGYLLLTGLPEGEKKRNRIIPTQEIITKCTFAHNALQ